MTESYRLWRGQPARYVRQARAAPKGQGRGFWFVIPPDRLQRHERELLRLGYPALGDLLRVDVLRDHEGLHLSNMLSLTQREKNEYVEYGATADTIEAEEDALLARCPRVSVSGWELDVTDDLKGTHAARDALLDVGQAIRHELRQRGQRVTWGWSASCPHGSPWDCPEGGDCPEGYSGLHGVPGLALPEAQHPWLANVYLEGVVRPVAREQRLVLSDAVPDGYSGVVVDVSTLRPAAASRGSVFRVAMGAPHGTRGPKIPCRQLRDDPTPLSARDLALGVQIVERRLATAALRERDMAARPARPPAAPVPILEASKQSAFPHTLKALRDMRPEDPGKRHRVTLGLSTELLKLGGLTQAQITDLLQVGLQRSDRRAVQHAVETSADMLARAAKAPPGARRDPLGKRGLIEKDGHYLDMVKLAVGLSRDLDVPLFKLYRSLCRVSQAAGTTRVQKRAREVRQEIGRDSPYYTVLKNCAGCGVQLNKACSQHGPNCQHVTCKTIFCDYCRPYGMTVQACTAMQLWEKVLREDEREARARGLEGRSTIAAAEFPEYPTSAEAHRARERATPMVGARWSLGYRGPGRWYFTLLVHGIRAGDVAAMIPGTVSVVKDLDHVRAADLVLANQLLVHAGAQQALMAGKDAFVHFMQQTHDKNLTGAQRCGSLPWPKKGQRLEEPDHDEHDEECGWECIVAGCVRTQVIEPVTKTVVKELTSWAPSLAKIVSYLEQARLLDPEQRIDRVIAASRSERAGRVLVPI